VPVVRLLEIAAEYGLHVMPRRSPQSTFGSGSNSGGGGGRGDSSKRGYPQPPHTHIATTDTGTSTGFNELWAVGMHDTITNVCMRDGALASLRTPMAVMGPRSPGRGVSGEEWGAIGIYMNLILEKKGV
jgi:hypothetical protein